MPAKTKVTGLLFHVSMIVDALALHDITTAAADRAFDVQIKPIPKPPIEQDTGPPGEPVQHGNSRAGRAMQQSSRQVVVPMLMRGDVVTAEAIELAGGHGVTPSAVYTFFTSALKKKLVKRTAAGSYRLTAKGKKQFGAQTTADAAKLNGSAPPAHGGKQKFNPKHTDFVLLQIKGGADEGKTLRAAFVADNRPARSLDGAVGRLKEEKLIGSIGLGKYKLLAKGEQHLAAQGN